MRQGGCCTKNVFVMTLVTSKLLQLPILCMENAHFMSIQHYHLGIMTLSPHSWHEEIKIHQTQMLGQPNI